MTYKQTQDIPGTPKSSVPNKTQRTGRPDGTEALRGEGKEARSDNYPIRTTPNTTKRTGTDPRKLAEPNSTTVFNDKTNTPTPVDVSAPKRTQHSV